jgi:putative ABC transport system permease protein
MNIFQLAIKNIAHRKATGSLSILLLAFGITVMALVFNIQAQLDQKMRSNLANIDMVVAAKGSPLQIILCNVFHIDYPTGNIKIKDVEWLNKNPLVKKVYPISLGDSYKNVRLLGCDTSYFSLYEAEIIQGRYFNHDFEVVIGSSTAKKTGLNIGSEFSSQHGLDSEIDLSHDHQHFTVVGVLEPKGNVIDDLIITSNESIRRIHHNNQAEEEKEVTALLLKFRNPLAAVQLPRIINAKSNLQAASPAFEMARLFSLLDNALSILRYFSLVIMVIAGLSIFVALYASLRNRKFEMALIRSLGASRIFVFFMILVEALILAIIGCLLGIMAAHSFLFLYGLNDSTGLLNSLDPFFFVFEEVFLIIFGFLIAVIASIIPAYRAFKTDISETLSHA